MSSYPKHAPKHRAATPHRAPQAARRVALKTSLTLSSMAVIATGVAVGTGALALPVVTGASAQSADTGTRAVAAAARASTPSAASATPSPASDSEAADAAAAALGASLLRTQAETSAAAADREQVVTRSDTRESTDPLKADALSLGQGNTMARSESLDDQSPQLIAQALLSSYGWSQSQFGCLDSLWTRESGWNVHADNPYSSAYGIPQALPGSKMASVGADWATNPVTQIKWGLGYIADRYGSPCGAWAHSQSSGFY